MGEPGGQPNAWARVGVEKQPPPPLTRRQRAKPHSCLWREEPQRAFSRIRGKSADRDPSATSSCVAAPGPILTIQGCPVISVSSATHLLSVRRCSDGPVNVV